jgi:hypothetical protein
MFITEISYDPISIVGLDLVYNGDYDDTNFFIELPTPFDVNFLGVNYTSVYVSSNPFITFGNGSSSCCFDIPNQIPSNVGFPGVFLSFECPNNPGDYDSNLYQLYTGLTDGGNTMVIKFVGTDHCDEIVNLIYGFKFYKDISDYFDLIIEDNTSFFNGDPTGGVNDGVSETWLGSFNSSSEKSYRFYAEEPSRSANTESTICVQICSTGDTMYENVVVNPPHPEWTDNYGVKVTQLNMITLGGNNGLNN